jgi:hypothetical protein
MYAPHAQWYPLLPLGKRSVANAAAGGTLRAAGAASAAEQSRWAAKSSRWGGLLTLAAKSGIIIFVGRKQICPHTWRSVLALLAH